MGMKLSLSFRDNDVVGLVTDGTITNADYQAGDRNPVEQLLGSGWGKEKVLIGLDKTSYIDSSGIGWLMDIHRTCKAAGGKLIIHSMQPGVRQMLGLLRLEKVLTIVDNEAAARAAATNGGAK
jgi:anti-anti-sigma factor